MKYMHTKYFFIIVFFITGCSMNTVNYDTNSTLEKLYKINDFTNNFDVPLHLHRSEIYRKMVRQPESYFLAFYEILEMDNVPDSVKSITGYVTVHADLDKYMKFLNKAIAFRKSNKITDDVLYRISAPGPPWLTKIVYNYKKKEVRETYKKIAESPEVAEYVSQYASRVLSGEASKSIREYMDAYPEMDNYWGK